LVALRAEWCHLPGLLLPGLPEPPPVSQLRARVPLAFSLLQEPVSEPAFSLLAFCQKA
jgi:hypothetical protein